MINELINIKSFFCFDGHALYRILLYIFEVVFNIIHISLIIHNIVSTI